MAGGLTIKVIGLDRLQARLREKGQNMGRVLVAAVTSGGKVIANEASNRSPAVTGTNADSIVTPPVKDIQTTATSCKGKIGPTTPYGRRLELGFVGEDSLGRNYHQAAQPYLRPALAATREEAKQEMIDVLKEAINQ